MKPGLLHSEINQFTPPPHPSCFYKAHSPLAAPGLKQYYITQSHHFHWNKIPKQVSLRYKTENEISTNLLNKLVTDNFFFTPKMSEKRINTKIKGSLMYFCFLHVIFTYHLYYRRFRRPYFINVNLICN